MSRDRRLAEMMGLCWHEMDRNPLNPHLMCAKCQKMWRDIPDNPDFSLPEWRAKLMDFCVEQEWWDSFATWVGEEKHEGLEDFTAYLWRNLADLVYEYDKERKGEGDE